MTYASAFIVKRFKEYGFEVLQLIELTDKSYSFKVRRGVREVIVFIALMGLGNSKSIEDNLAKLIELVYGVKVKCTKADIIKWLEGQELRDVDLIKYKAPRQRWVRINKRKGGEYAEKVRDAERLLAKGYSQLEDELVTDNIETGTN